MADVGALNRAIHIAASLLPAGFCVFALLLSRPAAAKLGDQATLLALRSRLIVPMRWSLPVAFVSGLIWLAAEALSMSGLPFRDAITPDVLGTVLGSTLFGRLWLLRAALLAALATWLLRPRLAEDGAGAEMLGLLLAAAFAASLAWAGHAAGLEGGEGATLLASQVVHLLATAGWLGALLPLVIVLGEARRTPSTFAFAAAVTRRFSTLGVACVAALVISGLVNSWVLVGSIPALFGTAYGRLLLLKIALFLAMLSLAAVNRFRLTPALEAASARMVRALWRTATVETVLGLGIVAIVGFLGATPPGAHEAPLWPFSFSLSTAPIIWDGRLDDDAMIALAVAGLGLVIMTVGAVARHPIVVVLGAIGAIGGGGNLLAAMRVPAYPTSFMPSPAPFSTASITHGARVYAEHCVTCHGAAGRGDGPAAAALRPPPADLTAHLGDHSDGEIFWWIGNGMAGSAMPGFAAQIGPDRRWDLVQFLRAQADAAQAAVLKPQASRFTGFEAPDFTFQIDGGSPETLADQRGRANVILVFYRRPASDRRLLQLAAVRSTLSGARIIAIPIQGAPDIPDTAEIAAQAAPETVDAYALYGAGTEHVEYLIDRSGYLRARWRLADGGGWDDIAELTAQIAVIEREPFRPAEPRRHVH